MSLESLHRRIDALREKVEPGQKPQIVTQWGNEPLPEPEKGMIIIATTWGTPRLEDEEAI